MPYGRTWREIEELIVDTVLYVPTARDIVRRSGLLRYGGVNVGAPVSVMSEGWIIEMNPAGFPDEEDPLNDVYGLLFDPAGGFPETMEFWPMGEVVYVARVDLSGYVALRNIVFVDPDSPHPPLNVRVEASLDGTTWGSPTVHDPEDWLYAGCNVNLGNWPATLGDETGGAITSSWQEIDIAYRSEDVLLRWVFFVSPVSDDSPYDIAANDWGALRVGYADVQAS